jgi:hypothetical protein
MANKKIIDSDDSDDENFYGSLEETMNLQDLDDGDDQVSRLLSSFHFCFL